MVWVINAKKHSPFCMRCRERRTERSGRKAELRLFPALELRAERQRPHGPPRVTNRRCSLRVQTDGQREGRVRGGGVSLGVHGNDSRTQPQGAWEGAGHVGSRRSSVRSQHPLLGPWGHTAREMSPRPPTAPHRAIAPGSVATARSHSSSTQKWKSARPANQTKTAQKLESTD